MSDFTIFNIRKYREANELTEYQVSEYLGIPKEKYFWAERYEEELSVEEIEKLADLYGIDAIQFTEASDVDNTFLKLLGGEKISVNDLKHIAKFRAIIKASEFMNRISGIKGDSEL